MSSETQSRFDQTVTNIITASSSSSSSSSPSSSIEHNTPSIPNKEMPPATSVSQIKRITSIDGIWIIDKQEIVENLTNIITKSQTTIEDLKGTQEPPEIILNSPGVVLDVKQVQKVFDGGEKFQSCGVKLAQSLDSAVEVQETAQNDGKKRSVKAEEEEMVGKNENGVVRNVKGKVCSENGIERNVKGKVCSENGVERNGNENVCSENGVERNMEEKVCSENGLKKRYSKDEMQSLRFLNVDEQKTMWDKVYIGMGSIAAREYDSIAGTKPQQNQGHKNADHRQRFVKRKENVPVLTKPKKKENGMVWGEMCNQNMEHNLPENTIGGDCSLTLDKFEEDNALHSSYAGCASDVAFDCKMVDTECDEAIGSDSEDEFDNIQRPAFLVEGDPDFDTGPPQDGLEYLRRVRWEASQIPKVKVAKMTNRKNEQTVYMPALPDIAQCPSHLLPCKLWEDAFLADFSELRSAFIQSESVFLERPKHLQKHPSSDPPSMSTVVAMDAVSRAKMLRTRISSLEGMNSLSRNECAWLYALCAAVDTPLDADTSASLRCLLRKCAKLRSEKVMDCDDDLAMLNILVTISGKYFGQLER